MAGNGCVVWPLPDPHHLQLLNMVSKGLLGWEWAGEGAGEGWGRGV